MFLLDQGIALQWGSWSIQHNVLQRVWPNIGKYTLLVSCYRRNEQSFPLFFETYRDELCATRPEVVEADVFLKPEAKEQWGRERENKNMKLQMVCLCFSIENEPCKEGANSS